MQQNLTPLPQKKPQPSNLTTKQKNSNQINQPTNQKPQNLQNPNKQNQRESKLSILINSLVLSSDLTGKNMYPPQELELLEEILWAVAGDF